MGEMIDRLPTKGPRLPVLDAQRGLIMVLMALDHASYFIARVHSLEFWGTSLPVYPNAFWFWTRWVTHPCAPGFFFLMGIGMVLFAASRREAGWQEGRITRFFIVRGLLLVLLQLLVEDPAWVVGYLSANPGAMITRTGGVPGGGTGGIVYLGVLFALGGTMVFWACVRRVSSQFICVISLAAIVTTQLVTPGSERIGALYTPLARSLIIPGHTNSWEVFYPVVPWLGVTGLGLLFGRLLKNDTHRAGRVAGPAGLACILLFVVVRAIGSVGNLNDVPSGWLGFLNVVKYPPSLVFLAITLGINLIAMTAWERAEPYFQNPRNPLLVFGRVPLFFYLVHLWMYCLLGLFFAGGSGLAAMYCFWLVGLVLLYPLCYAFNRFKQRRPVDSIWRLF
ncbi:MAG TPA: heparan-alpha-glucosaminide N-acetyltransferase domain-containing protein [Syntrophorhabdales bacterium]|nr:heparan-alpha-glucosaminide N-acetyltransferase domain-containing protein [Syntrophorhabdales bacterium]